MSPWQREPRVRRRTRQCPTRINRSKKLMICLTQFPIFCVIEQTTQQQPVRPKQPSAAPPPATATVDPAPVELQGPVPAAPPAQPVRAQVSKPAAAAKNKGGDPDRKELFKMTVTAMQITSVSVAKMKL